MEALGVKAGWAHSFRGTARLASTYRHSKETEKGTDVQDECDTQSCARRGAQQGTTLSVSHQSDTKH